MHPERGKRIPLGSQDTPLEFEIEASLAYRVLEGGGFKGGR